MGTAEAAERWGVSPDRVRIWCREGKIEGATQDKKYSAWHIPKDAKPPRARRKKSKGD